MTTTDPRAQIVVGVSTSLSGLAALRFAVNEARRREITQITAVRAWLDTSERRPSPWAPNVMKICVGEITTAITTAFMIRPGDVVIQPRVPRGLPGPALINLVANDSDMIVVGTRRRFRPGVGVGGYCARHAPCPVVIVPPPSMVGRANTRHFSRSLRRELNDLAAWWSYTL